MGAPVVHFEIMGGQGSQLEEFYKALSGWTIDSNNPMKYGMVDTGGPGGINGGVGTSQDGKNRVSLYIEVENLDAALAEAEKLDATTILPPSQVPVGPTLAMFSDPAGDVTGPLFRKGVAQ